MYRVIDYIIFDATLIYFTRLYHVFIIFTNKFYKKVLLLVIDYVKFLTCPTILTQRPTSFIGIL